MIAKHIHRSQKSSFSLLANYIAAAKDKGEKLHKLWIETCNAGQSPDNLDLAIKEIIATQAQNTRTKLDKTYHLLISFQDGEKPSDQQLIDIEKAYAKALGFEDHQRICATHQNTDHYHIHVAYNKIHPQKLTMLEPHRDYFKLEKTSRALEKKYGLKIDNGRQDKLSHDRKNVKANDYESHTWQQSFQSYVIGEKEHMIKDLQASKNWQEFHQRTRDYNIRFKPKGAGLVIENLKDKQTIKASSLGREFSKASLEAKLGRYSPMINEKQANVINSKGYKPRSLIKHKSITPMWNKFKQAKKKNSLLNNFKQFLIYQALEINDPLAMTLIYWHNKIIGDLIGTGNRSPVKQKSIMQKSNFNINNPIKQNLDFNIKEPINHQSYKTMMAADFISQMKNNILPWQKNQQIRKYQGKPINPITGKYYYGANASILENKGYDDPRFITRKQINQHGLTILPNQKPTIIEYCKKSKDSDKNEFFYGQIFNAKQIKDFDIFAKSLANNKVTKIDKANSIDRIKKIIDRSNDNVILDSDSGAFIDEATAEEMGYFKEDAISSDDAIKSNYQNDDLFYSDMLKNICAAKFDDENGSNDKMLINQELKPLAVLMAHHKLSQELGIDYQTDKTSNDIRSWSRSIKNDDDNLSKLIDMSDKIKNKLLWHEDYVYLDVPFNERDDAVKLGARWDDVAKSWCVKNDADLYYLQKWDGSYFDNDIAEEMGCFKEDAISYDDIMDSLIKPETKIINKKTITPIDDKTKKIIKKSNNIEISR